MPPRRNNHYVVSSPEEDDTDDGAPANPQTPSGDYGGNNGGATSNSSNALNLQNMTLNSSNTTSSNPQRPSLSPIPLDISSSDDEGEANSPDFGDFAEFGENGFGGVFGILRSMGLNLKREWFESCMSGVGRGVEGFEGFEYSRKAKLCFEQVLNADLNLCGAGVLPRNVKGLHLVQLDGPFILQVDEIVNISCPLRTRYQKAAPGIKRCLKLSMMDGVQRVFGMEYRPISALDVFAPAGMKVAISNVCVRHGLLMLVPEAFAVLGGVVEELEAARERLVQEVNKPPRGKRSRSGVVPPLAAKATLAAWPEGNASGSVQTNISRVDCNNLHTAEQGIASGARESVRGRQHTALPNNQETGTTSFSGPTLNGATLHTPASCVSLHTPASRAPTGDGAREHTAQQSHKEAGITSFSLSALNGAALHTPGSRALASDRAREHTTPRNHQEAVTTSFSAPALNGVALHTPASRAVASDRTRDHTALQSHQEAGATSFSASALDGAPLHTPARRMTEDMTPSSNRHSMHTNYVAEATDVEEINMADEIEATDVEDEEINMADEIEATDVEEINMADEIEFPYILNAEKEIPFTYLASLSAKFAVMGGKVRHVQGMIKCVAIGVKRFQYKETDKYELRLYVDDGSLISEILADHNLVERLIGHPPQVVAAGMVSSDGNLQSYTKKTLMQFQSFLGNFEGMMLIQLSEACPFPVAMEMKEGCTVSDAWKLLARLKPSTSTPQPQHCQFDPIELSP